MARNALAAGGVFEPEPGNALAGNYTAADAADWHRQNLADTWAAVRDPQTWADAAAKYGQGLLMGSVAPEMKALGLDAQGMKVLRDMSPGAKAAVMDNPAFAKWFGASKVANPDGSPLVVYHGTTANVDAFTKASRGSATKSTDAKQGFFFTDSPKVASDFTPIIRDGALDRTTSAPGSNVMPVHLKMENPAEWDWGGGVSDAKGMMEAIRDAKKNGNDGLIISNIRDGGFSPSNGSASTHYIVFDPKQIKSAIGNSGKFDPKDPRITAGLAGLMAGGGAAAGVNAGNAD